MDYKSKYIKYKEKYINLKNIQKINDLKGGDSEVNIVRTDQQYTNDNYLNLHGQKLSSLYNPNESQIKTYMRSLGSLLTYKNLEIDVNFINDFNRNIYYDNGTYGSDGVINQKLLFEINKPVDKTDNNHFVNKEDVNYICEYHNHTSNSDIYFLKKKVKAKVGSELEDEAKGGSGSGYEAKAGVKVEDETKVEAGVEAGFKVEAGTKDEYEDETKAEAEAGSGSKAGTKDEDEDEDEVVAVAEDEELVLKTFNCDIDEKNYLSLEIGRIRDNPIILNIQPNYYEISKENFHNKNYNNIKLDDLISINSKNSVDIEDEKLYLSCKNNNAINDFIINIILQKIQIDNKGPSDFIKYHNLFITKINGKYKYCLLMDKIDGNIQDLYKKHLLINYNTESSNIIKNISIVILTDIDKLLNFIKQPQFLFNHTDLKLENVFYKKIKIHDIKLTNKSLFYEYNDNSGNFFKIYYNNNKKKYTLYERFKNELYKYQFLLADFDKSQITYKNIRFYNETSKVNSQSFFTTDFLQSRKSSEQKIYVEPELKLGDNKSRNLLESQDTDSEDKTGSLGNILINIIGDNNNFNNPIKNEDGSDRDDISVKLLKNQLDTGGGGRNDISDKSLENKVFIRSDNNKFRKSLESQDTDDNFVGILIGEGVAGGGGGAGGGTASGRSSAPDTIGPNLDIIDPNPDKIDPNPDKIDPNPDETDPNPDETDPNLVVIDSNKKIYSLDRFAPLRIVGNFFGQNIESEQLAARYSMFPYFSSFDIISFILSLFTIPRIYGSPKKHMDTTDICIMSLDVLFTQYFETTWYDVYKLYNTRPWSNITGSDKKGETYLQDFGFLLKPLIDNNVSFKYIKSYDNPKVLPLKNSYIRKIYITEKVHKLGLTIPIKINVDYAPCDGIWNAVCRPRITTFKYDKNSTITELETLFNKKIDENTRKIYELNKLLKTKTEEKTRKTEENTRKTEDNTKKIDELNKLLQEKTEDTNIVRLKDDNVRLKDDNVRLKDDRARLKDDNVRLNDNIKRLNDDIEKLKNNIQKLNNDIPKIKHNFKKINGNTADFLIFYTGDSNESSWVIKTNRYSTGILKSYLYEYDNIIEDKVTDIITNFFTNPYE
jgi:hypothetical protein